MRPTPLRLLASVLVVLGVVMSGCAVSEPDPSAWRDQAKQTLDDVGSEVATARLVLVQLDDGRLPSAYGVTMAADAEEAASKAEDKLSSLQAPRALGGLPDKVLTLVGKATEAVQQAREAVVAGHYDGDYLLAELDRLGKALDRRKAAL